MSDGMSYPEEVPLGRPMEGYIDKSLVYGDGPSLQEQLTESTVIDLDQLIRHENAVRADLGLGPILVKGFPDEAHEAEIRAWQEQASADRRLIQMGNPTAQRLQTAIAHIDLGLEALEELLRGMVLHEAGDNYRRQQEMLKLLASMRGD